MTARVAVAHDDYGPGDSSSPIWSRLLEERGIEVIPVDPFSPTAVEELARCDGFLWRFAHLRPLKRVARSLLPIAEDVLGLVVFPERAAAWHYDDKVSQQLLLAAIGAPTPYSRVWFSLDQAVRDLPDFPYPAVLKLASGAGSTNVAMVPGSREALAWAGRMFGEGVFSLDPKRRRLRAPRTTLEEHNADYLLLQQFVPGNDHDLRVTVIGDRAFAFRRFNRPGDFRASGSGALDWDVSAIDPAAIDLAFRTVKAIGASCLALDLLLADRYVVVEISYTFASWAVARCPGHWRPDLSFVSGQMSPEEAQIEDFVERLASRR